MWPRWSEDSNSIFTPKVKDNARQKKKTKRLYTLAARDPKQHFRVLKLVYSKSGSAAPKKLVYLKSGSVAPKKLVYLKSGSEAPKDFVFLKSGSANGARLTMNMGDHGRPRETTPATDFAPGYPLTRRKKYIGPLQTSCLGNLHKYQKLYKSITDRKKIADAVGVWDLKDPVSIHIHTPNHPFTTFPHPHTNHPFTTFPWYW